MVMLPEYWEFIAGHPRGLLASAFAVAVLFLDQTVAVIAAAREKAVAVVKSKRSLEQSD
jgi:hypothetical protein